MLQSNTHSFPSNGEVSLVAELGAKHCIFRCGEAQYALAATALREVTHAPALVRVPHCPRSLAGICHIRSEFVPVVFLDPLLGDRESHIQEPKQLLVLTNSLGPWALMIDRVIAIDSIETHVDVGPRNEGQLAPVLGTATYRSVVVRVLDPNALHRIVQQSRYREWSSMTTPASTNRIDQRTLV